MSDIPCGADNSTFRRGIAASGRDGHLDLAVTGNDRRLWTRSWGQVDDGAWVETARICQLTGDADAEALLHVNRTSAWGCEGTDMGVPIEHEGRLYLFFGDVMSHNNIDPITFTYAPQPDPNDLGLTPILAEGTNDFQPFRIDDGSGPRSLGTNETPTGGFGYGPDLWVFCVTGDAAPVSYLTRSSDPSEPFEVQLKISSHDGPGRFLLPHGLVLQAAAWPEIRPVLGAGVVEALVVWGWGIGNDEHGQPSSVPAGINLAMAPIGAETGVAWEQARYWSPAGWQDSEVKAAPLIPAMAVTHVSVAWLPDAQQFVMLTTRSSAGDRTGAIVAHLGASPWEWSGEIVAFDPLREGAYGRFMHWPGCDDLDARFTCAVDRGWSYAPGLAARFTKWDPAARLLSLYYTMSTGAPYEVQLMRTTLRIEP